MTPNCLLIEDDTSEKERHGSLFGLISEAEVDAMELHGFEVDMDGRVLIPELHPHQDHSVSEARRCSTR